MVVSHVAHEHYIVKKNNVRRLQAPRREVRSPDGACSHIRNDRQERPLPRLCIPVPCW